MQEKLKNLARGRIEVHLSKQNQEFERLREARAA